MNLLEAGNENGKLHVNDSLIQFPLGSATEKLPTHFIMGIRPEDVQPGEQGDFSGEVALIEPLGVETILHIKSGQQMLLSTVSGMTRWRINDPIRFNIVREHLHYFDKSSQNRIIGARQAQLEGQPG